MRRTLSLFEKLSQPVPLFTVVSTMFFTVVAGFTCPPATSIAPCACSAEDVRLSCTWYDVSQAHIDNLFTAVRSANGLTLQDKLTINEFSLQETVLTILDLTPLQYTSVKDILISYNRELHTITGSPLPEPGAAIEANSLIIEQSALTDDGIDFRFFAPTLTSLSIVRSRIQGGKYELEDGSGDVEFLRGFGDLTSLQEFIGDQNEIRVLGGGQFRRNVRLSTMYLAKNQIEELGEGAFILDEIPPGGGDNITRRDISLYDNYLTVSSIHPNNGLDSLKGMTDVDLTRNIFESLQQNIWEGFLYANNHTNSISFYQNQLYCNGTMRWLKEQREDFESRVYGANCANDPGHTIFDTEIDLG